MYSASWFKHHIEEEEGDILPQAQDSDVDWEALNAKVIKRREQLMSWQKVAFDLGIG